MKRKITLSIALVLSITLAALMSSDSTVNAEPPERFEWDTGVVALGEDQELRVTAVGALDLNDLYILLKRQSFTQGVCNGGVCKLAVSSEDTSAPMPLMPGEALSVAVDPSDPNVIYVRAMVMSNRRNVRVTATIINTLTGEATSHIIVANTEGDIH